LPKFPKPSPDFAGKSKILGLHPTGLQSGFGFNWKNIGDIRANKAQNKPNLMIFPKITVRF
jgi:hypothetical protein